MYSENDAEQARQTRGIEKEDYTREIITREERGNPKQGRRFRWRRLEVEIPYSQPHHFPNASRCNENKKRAKYRAR
jgi:hypothetical protein